MRRRGDRTRGVVDVRLQDPRGLHPTRSMLAFMLPESRTPGLCVFQPFMLWFAPYADGNTFYIADFLAGENVVVYHQP